MQQYIFLCCLALYGFVLDCVSIETKVYTHEFPRGNRINVYCNRLVNAKLNMISHKLKTMCAHKYVVSYSCIVQLRYSSFCYITDFYPLIDLKCASTSRLTVCTAYSIYIPKPKLMRSLKMK